MKAHRVLEDWFRPSWSVQACCFPSAEFLLLGWLHSQQAVGRGACYSPRVTAPQQEVHAPRSFSNSPGMTPVAADHDPVHPQVDIVTLISLAWIQWPSQSRRTRVAWKPGNCCREEGCWAGRQQVTLTWMHLGFFRFVLSH